MSIQTPWTVSDLNKIIKTTLEATPFFERVSVHGELSNLTKASSGHWYFTLKDATSRLTCVMFSSAVRHLNHPFKEGDQVEVVARVTFYEPGGTLQLNISSMQLFGVGSLFAQLEQLRLKLQKEGLFDQSHKKPLPRYPRSIGVITSLGSAAHADVLKTISSRWPVAQVTSYGTLVQGEGSVLEIIQALKKADNSNHDVLIIARGGGSIEDLWSFNHEALIRHIYTLSTPIVSGIGHESDTTLIDYVVDVRGPTPTGAATVSTPLIDEVIHVFDQYALRLRFLIENRINQASTKLHHQSTTLMRLSPQKLVEKRKYLVENAQIRLDQVIKRPLLRAQIEQKQRVIEQSLQRYVQFHSTKLMQYSHQLSSLDMMKPLKRGFALIQSDDHLITSIQQVSLSQTLNITLQDGVLETSVKTIKENPHDTTHL
jgi:exodeoxyribonuclease VII large subunit